MEFVTGDRYLDSLVKFVEKNTGGLIEGTLILKLNPVGLHYVQSRLDALCELEGLIAGAPVDYLRAYVSDLGDHRALEQLRRILCRLTSLKIVSVLPFPSRDPTPLSLLSFGRLKVLELRGCDLSTSAAKGLLELRYTLEKLICHNSTEALRHVFASRIADIKESPQWNRLSFVSCACNGLILMDESLHLLPAVETLDLSRNKFAKVDNLRKSTRLTHLDLGFNQLRSVASFSEVTCHILKLVLRNNALTTLRGIENLLSIEELDVSYNIISNYVELEVFSNLPSLRKIWLEGNPLCCIRWYRPQVFSFFLYPEQVKLDDKEMSTREFWKRQIIIARRQRRPASYGYYFPAKEENELERFMNGRRKKYSRLACIESDEPGTNMFCEQDSVSCKDDVQGGEDDVSDKESDLASLINRIEVMKKERPKLWLEEFKDWIDHGSENCAGENKDSLTFTNSNVCESSNFGQYGECSRCLEYVSDSIMNSGDDSSRNVQESKSSFASSAGNPGYQWLHAGSQNGETKPRLITRALDEDHLRFHFPNGENSLQNVDFDSAIFGTNEQNGEEVNVSAGGGPSTSIKNLEMTSSSGLPVSPPHYEEDILYRRHSLEEEFLQLSVESFSLASSDSNTSDDDHRHECGPPFPKSELLVDDEVLAQDINWKVTPLLDIDDNGLHISDVGRRLDSCVQQSTRKLGGHDVSSEVLCGNKPLGGKNDEKATDSNRHDTYCYEMNNSKRRPKKRVVSLSDSTSVDRVDVKDWLQPQALNLIGRAGGSVSTSVYDEATAVHAHSKYAVSKVDSHIENYFNSLVADSTIQETCEQFIMCNCVVGKESMCRERQVAVILSNESKLYVILLNGMVDGSGNSLSLMTSHKVKDVSEVLLGLGLLVIWVYIDEGTSYLLITRCKKKTRQLLCMVGLTSHEDINNCSLRSVGNFIGSLEQFQLNLFDRHIAGSSGVGIYQYCMVLFEHKYSGVEWVSRSLFVSGGDLVLCIEDIMHFNSITQNEDAASYFLLDSCCSIADISGMVIEAKENQSVTLIFKEDFRVSCFQSIVDTLKLKAGFQKTSVRPKTWKLKWFSVESLCKFVTLLHAIHRELTSSTLSIVYLS